MNIKFQVISLLFSFLYGSIIFSLIKKLYRYLTIKKTSKRVLYNLGFSIFISLIYFIIMYFLNNGYIHLYYLLSLVLGILVVYQLTK